MAKLLCLIGLHHWIPERYLTAMPWDEKLICQRCYIEKEPTQ